MFFDVKVPVDYAIDGIQRVIVNTEYVSSYISLVDEIKEAMSVAGAIHLC